MNAASLQISQAICYDPGVPGSRDEVCELSGLARRRLTLTLGLGRLIDGPGTSEGGMGLQPTGVNCPG